MIYYNYHKHDHYGNPWTIDTIAKPEDYCKRAVELGHTAVFTTNHGVQGNIFDWIENTKKYDLKMCFGTETYFVYNRFANSDGKRDRSNKHLIIIAKNNSGVMQLNDILSEAHTTGFYYKPRIDKELLFSLNPHDFVITSACVAGIWDDHELCLEINNYFKDNFFLEVQAHDIEIQKKVNSNLLDFSRAAKIPLIHANDSHYIYAEGAKDRNIFLKGKGMRYSDEDGMILDYPDSDEIFKRYKKQGILTLSQVQEALENTYIFEDCEPITFINDDIKLPSVSDSPTQDLKNIINDGWKKERKEIPKEKRSEYISAIQYEMDIVEKTHMENYFLIDYNVAKIGQEKYGGKLTNTGRGSAPSFYITKLLGLTNIDRLAAPITLFPTRFMSVERILGTRSLPDIDLNTADREPFIKATEDILGKENCAWMLAWKPLQDASAFRVYCKGIGKDINEYDNVAKNLNDYRDDPKWKSIIEESKKFIGVVESVSESPCSMLLHSFPVRKELGLVRTSKGVACCLLDGYNCDKYKYLKNDYLSATVWAIIRDTCKAANIPIPTIRELDKLLDDETFKVYEDGLTCTINQVDSDFATSMVKIYKPKSVSEMSAFVAIIRPGCASLLQDFVNRKDYTTGVAELDEQLIEGNHRMIYQELIMRYLIWLGIPETGSYDIIKKIAKKKFKEQELADLKEKLLKGWMEKVGREEGFNETWTVVEQAAHYSFNASHSLSYAYDSLYGAYLKSHYPLEYYTTALNYYIGDETRTAKLSKELDYYGISLRGTKFRHSSANYNFDKETNEIFKGISSIKYLNSQVAEEIYDLRDNQYLSFTDLLYDIRTKTSTDSKQLKILIKLDFFEEFGDANKLLYIADMFESFWDKSKKAYKTQLKKDKAEELNLDDELLLKTSERATAKTYFGINPSEIINGYFQTHKIHERLLKEKIESQLEYLGYIDISDKRYSRMLVILSIDTKYSPRLKVYSLKNGTILEVKIDKKTYNRNKLEKCDIIHVSSQIKKPKSRWQEDGTYKPIPGTSEIWLTKYERVKNI